MTKEWHGHIMSWDCGPCLNLVSAGFLFHCSGSTGSVCVCVLGGGCGFMTTGWRWKPRSPVGSCWHSNVGVPCCHSTEVAVLAPCSLHSRQGWWNPPVGMGVQLPTWLSLTPAAGAAETRCCNLTRRESVPPSLCWHSGQRGHGFFCGALVE